MKPRTIILSLAVMLVAVGCGHVDETASRNAAVYSARDAAVQSENLARKLYENGQASSMNEARTQAATQVNSNWATESRRVEKKRAQEKFAKELAKMK